MKGGERMKKQWELPVLEVVEVKMTMAELWN
ncbi:paeninodin family lasso peptide [Priestia flexa]|nr:paeninodin family lasso peptide [Priestia flexa]